MGFRSRVRHFRGTILGLLRPSEPRCFAAGSCFFPWCFPIWGPDVKVAKIHGSSKRRKEPKASFSMGFRSRVRHFRGTILGLLRPSEPRCFAAGSCFFRSLTGIRSSSRRHQSCEQPQATLDNLSRQSTNVFFLGLQTQTTRSGVFSRGFGASWSFRAMMFCCRELLFSKLFYRHQQQQPPPPVLRAAAGVIQSHSVLLPRGTFFEAVFFRAAGGHKF